MKSKTLTLLLLILALALSGCATMRDSPLPSSNAAPLATRTLSNGELGNKSSRSVDNQRSQSQVSQARVRPRAVAETEPHRFPGSGQQANCWLVSYETSAIPVTALALEAKASQSRDTTGFHFDYITRRDQPQAPLLEGHSFGHLIDEQWTGIINDHLEFYSPESLAWLAGGVGVGASMANTGFDENFVRDTYFDNIVFAPSDEVYEKLHQPKFLGDGYYTIPIFAIAALAEPLIEDLPMGSESAEWGQRSLRTILVGGPPMLGLQLLTGGSRPGETTAGSKWKPFQDDNGVSGHSFMGAIPFMSAAKMTNNMWLKGGLYAASTLPALSRVNDDRHYFSQAFLGWWLAYLAETAVDHSHDPNASYRFFAYPEPGGVGIGFEYVH